MNRALTRSRRRWLLRFATALAVAFVTSTALWRLRRGEFRLPAHIRVEEVIADLSASFDPAAVLRQEVSAPVQIASLKPGARTGSRRAMVASPPSLLRYRLRVPEDAFLTFGLGIESDGKRDPEASGIRFTVSVDGDEIFSRVVNPAATRREREWFDERVALRASPEREREIVLGTALTRPRARPAGRPGWSHVRVVRQTWRERQPASPTAPNVLVLLVDALRADRLGCYGNSPSPSPTLDRLAEGGLVFEQAIAHASWTMPAVASLFTGVHPRSHGVIGDPPAHAAAADGQDSYPTFLPDALRTFAEHAQDGGITTVGVSANAVISRGTNLAQGFETFVESGLDMRGERGKNWPTAAEVNAPLLQWLRQNRHRRFLGYLHYMEPHHPYTPPAHLRPPPADHVRPEIAAGRLAKWRMQVASAETIQLADSETAYVRRLYDAEIRGWDDELAVLLRALDSLGIRDSTVLVITADHGEEFQEHGRLQHGSHLYDESIHIPLIIAGPGVGRGRVAEQAAGIDLFPTITALLGLVPHPGLPGQNLLAPREERPVFSETRYGRLADGTITDLFSLRTPTWKLIWAPAGERYELYDLTADPAERHDRFGEAADGAGLARQLAAWRAQTPPPPPASGQDPHLREKLRALGYVE